jgi:hypothetical protein
MGTKARSLSISGGGSGANANISLNSLRPFLTTANVVELSNLYYTNARVVANISQLSINVFADVDVTGAATGQVLYLNNNNIWVSTLLTTALVPESNGNLYYTNARVRSALSAADNTIVYNSVTGTIRANLAVIANFANTTDGITEGVTNKYFSNARAFANLQQASIADLRDVEFPVIPANGQVLIFSTVSNTWYAGDYIPNIVLGSANTVNSISNFTTSNLLEGTNLYFTNARVLANLTLASIDIFADVKSTNNLANGKVLTWTGSAWEPANAGDFANVKFAQFADFASVTGSANSAATALFATVADSANVARVSDFANLSATSNLATLASLANSALVANFANTANIANTVLSLRGLTTANLAEGGTNLYYSNVRVLSILSQTSINVLNDVNITGVQTGHVLVWNGTEFVSNSIGAITNARTDFANEANIVLSLNNLSTSNLAEGTNLYFSNTRLRSSLPNAIGNLSITLTDLIVTNTLIASNLIASAKTLTIDNNEIVLNANANVLASPVRNAFVTIKRGNQPNVALKWNESTDKWQFSNDGAEYFNIPVPSDYLNGKAVYTIIPNVNSGAVTLLDSFASNTYTAAEYFYTFITTGGVGGGLQKYASGKYMLLHDKVITYTNQFGMLQSDPNEEIVTLTANINSGDVQLYGKASVGYVANVKLYRIYN